MSQQHQQHSTAAEPSTSQSIGERASSKEDEEEEEEVEEVQTPVDHDMRFDFLDQEISASESLLQDIPFRVSHQKSKSYYVVFAAVLAALGGVLFGYDVGIVSGALLQLSRDFHLSCFYQELVVSSMLVGALFASFVGGFLVDFCGRRITIIGNDIIFIIGAVILTCAPNFPVLIVGRMIVGFGVSLSAIAECVYISEIAPSAKRGMLVSLNELGITLGFLLAYLVNYAFINYPQGWRYMFGLSVIPALLQGVGMIYLPRSPRFLMIRRCEEQARQTLIKIRGTQDVDDELHSIRVSNNNQKPRSPLDLCRSADNMRLRFIIGMGLVLFQQITGQPNVLYYAPTIFLELGFHTDAAAVFATVGLGFVKVTFTIVSLLCVDHAGRRKFLLIGTLMMVFGVSILGLTATIQQPGEVESHCQTAKSLLQVPDHNTLNTMNQTKATSTDTAFYHTSNDKRAEHLGRYKRDHGLTYPWRMPTSNGTREILSRPVNEVIKWISFASLMIYIAGYAIGFGPVTWLVLSEIFPSHIRGRAISIATVGNWGANLVISLTFLNLMNLLTLPGTFYMYASICILAMVFIICLVPETKGRSLEEISTDLNQNFRMKWPLSCFWFCKDQRVSRRRLRYKVHNLSDYDYPEERHD